VRTDLTNSRFLVVTTNKRLFHHPSTSRGHKILVKTGNTGARVWCADEQIPHSTWHERVLSDRDFAAAAAKRRRAIGGPVDATHRRDFDAERSGESDGGPNVQVGTGTRSAS
jgi:hypothetical protein